MLQSLINVPHCSDWRELTDQIPDGAVNLLFLDPPYNIGVFCKMPPEEYMAWCCEWIAEGDRILAPNGAFWVSHKDPEVLVDISREIARLGSGRVNWVTWDKYNDAEPGAQYVMNRTKLHPQGKRSFDQDAEYLVYHADEGEWTSQCDRERGFIFEPLRAYLDGERKRAGVDKVAVNVACGFSASPGGMASRHYFSRSQWCLPTEEHYRAMQELFNRGGGDYLRREYDYLRREFESLRYTFNNPGKVSSVWQIPPAPRTFHPTPKPDALLQRILETTSNPGDLVVDFFAGSFCTARVAERLGRRWICGDHNPEYVERFRAEGRQLELL